ncbi:MAG: helix-turn-helix transcriptional regulator [Planctomycetes bacterium]|nr:helix-turn-helix transcriptional regulator [Planctomycetota bacterium]
MIEHPRLQSRRRSGIRIFYAPPPLDGKDLALHGVGVREWMRPGTVDRPGGTGDWLIMAYHQGMHFGERRSNGPSLMVWSPRHGHRYGCDEGEWCHSWIHCAGASVARLVAASGLPLDQPIAPIDMAGIERCLDGIHREAQVQPASDAVIVENLLHILLRTAARAARATDTAVPASLLNVRHHIDAAFTEPQALTDLARMADCSVGHLCAGFKRWFGVSAIDYAIGLRMQRARILLGDRNLSVHAVARAVGYEDLHHFSKLFRKRHGKPPSAMRG